MIQFIREWKEDADWEIWEIPSNIEHPKVLAMAFPHKDGGWFAVVYIQKGEEKLFIFPPVLETRDDMFLCTELILELDWTLEHWKELFPWDENEQFSNVHSETFFGGVISEYLKQFPDSPLKEMLAEKLKSCQSSTIVP